MLYDDTTAAQTYELYGPKEYSTAAIAKLVDREIYKKRWHINLPKAILRPLAAVLNRRNTVTLTLTARLHGRDRNTLSYHAHRTMPLLAFAAAPTSPQPSPNPAGTTHLARSAPSRT